jgi:hypothetical protein
MDGLLHSLYSARSVLVTSGEGMGKTYLVRQVWERLLTDGVTCAYFEPATPKTLLTEIADMAGVDIKNLEGRSKTVEVLKQELIQWFSVNRAVLIFDDAHYLEVKFRLWLKKLKDVGVPILLAAINPPRNVSTGHQPIQFSPSRNATKRRQRRPRPPHIVSNGPGCLTQVPKALKMRCLGVEVYSL